MEEEHDLRRDRVHSLISPDPDSPLQHAATAVLTRTSSDSSSSSVTVDNNNTTFHDFELHSPFPATRWTNQQHSLYLNSLEASFVNELHRSMRLRGQSLQNNSYKASKSHTLQNSPNMPRQQSLEIQGGFLKTISLERTESVLESTADSHVLAESQLGLTSVERWSSLTERNSYDDGLLCDEGIHGKRISTFSNTPPRHLEKQSNCQSLHLELVGSNTEVTDQSFKNEETRSSCKPMAKRLKTAAADASSNDQVVPFGNFHATDVSTISNSTSENKGRKLLSELPETFHFPKSDLPCCLRGRC